jgi:hypothetical protein
MAFMLIKYIHHYQTMQQQLLFVSDAKLEKSTTNTGGEKDGAASSTDAGGAKKDENVHTIARETEGSDKTTINIESRVFERVFLLVSSNKINNIHTNTNDIIYFHSFLLSLLGL